MLVSQHDMSPIVSVVIPVFNGAETLQRALHSVLAQTLETIEVLVVDDGSTDAGYEIANRIKDPRVICIRHESNRGASAARNTGILSSSGRYVAFIDADDEWHPDKLLNQYHYLSKVGRSTAAVCTGFFVRRFDSDAIYLRQPAGAGRWFSEMLDVCAVAPGSTLMVDRRIFDEIGVFSTDLLRFEDWDWLLRYLLSYDLGMIREPMATVHSKPYMGVKTVDVAAHNLLRRRGGDIRIHAGLFGERRFAASLWLERAIVRWRSGLLIPAVYCFARAVFLSPARCAKLLRRGMNKIAQGDM